MTVNYTGKYQWTRSLRRKERKNHAKKIGGENRQGELPFSIDVKWGDKEKNQKRKIRSM
jgi:hypothetical protein